MLYNGVLYALSSDILRIFVRFPEFVCRLSRRALPFQILSKYTLFFIRTSPQIVLKLFLFPDIFEQRISCPEQYM